MRLKKQIDDLTAKAATDVPFPAKPDYRDRRWSDFRAGLLELLRMNGLANDMDSSDGWDFNEDSQVFSTTWKRGWSLRDRWAYSGDRPEIPRLEHYVTLRLHVELDPRKPIAEEIERLQTEYAEFVEDFHACTRATVQALIARRKPAGGQP